MRTTSSLLGMIMGALVCSTVGAQDGWVTVPVSDIAGTRRLQRPALASDGYHVVVTWEESESEGETRVLVSSVAPSGELVFRTLPVAANDGDQTSPVISFDGVRFLLAWIEQVDSRRSIRARFVHPVDGPSDQVVEVARLRDVARDSYANQVNTTNLASTYAHGVHQLFWLDGTCDGTYLPQPNAFLFAAKLTTNGVVSRARTVAGPWLCTHGIDAIATTGGAAIAWSVTSWRLKGGSENMVYRATQVDDFAPQLVYHPWIGNHAVGSPRIAAFGTGFLTTWLASPRPLNPYVSVTTSRESSSRDAVFLTPSTGSGEFMTYDLIPEGTGALVYWTDAGRLHSCAIDESLTLCEPLSMFKAREVAVTKHVLGTVLATARPNGMVEIHLLFEPPPRRRGVRR